MPQLPIWFFRHLFFSWLAAPVPVPQLQRPFPRPLFFLPPYPNVGEDKDVIHANDSGVSRHRPENPTDAGGLLSSRSGVQMSLLLGF